MATYRKRTINPKAAFSLLSIVLFLLISILIPLAHKLVLNEAFSLSGLFSPLFIPWEISGLIAGLIIAFIGIFWLKELIMIRIIRIFLILFITLMFLLYASLKIT